MGNPLPGRLHVMSGWRTRQRPNHEGIDLTAPVGTPVMAVRPGRVTLITGNVGPAGCSIIVEHTADDETRYNHLRSKPRFRLGERVGEGQVIGHVGMTGRTTAPHLHFARYRLRAGRWVDVDPTTLLDFSTAAGGDPTPFNPTTEEDDMGFAFMCDISKPYYWFSFTRGKSRKLSSAEVVQMRSAERSGIPGNEIHRVGPGWYENQLKLGVYTS